MKRYSLAVAMLAGTTVSLAASAAGTPATRPAPGTAIPQAGVPHIEPLDVPLFPAYVVKAGEKLGLTTQQRQEMAKEVMATQEKVAAISEKLKPEVAKLQALLAQQKIDEQAAAAQLDKVLELEREIKKANLTLTISVAGKLTPLQRQQARALTPEDLLSGRSTTPADPKASALYMLAKLDMIATQREKAGADVTEARTLLSSVKTRVQEGKFEEASNMLNKARDLLQ